MRKYAIILLMFVGCLSGAGQTVDVVVVESVTRVECRDMSHMRTTHHQVYRLMHERAKELANFETMCSKWEKLVDFSVQVTDAQGKQVRKFKKGDLKRSDLSSNFMDDYYTLSLDYVPPIYPITIEFNWTEEASNGCFSFPAFAPLPSYNSTVEHASYELIVPSQMQCRYLCQNTTATVSQSTLDDGRIRYEAHMDNLPAIESEPYAPPAREIVPSILWAPSKFEFHGVPGDMSSWQDFGAWCHQLRSGRQELTEDFKAQLHTMTDTCTTARSKVEIIYNYLAQTTRYVSIQLGIGGWQPFAAGEVCRTGFGDCKALSNYMCAMLHEVGVPADYVLINSHRPRLVTDFPSNQFNHVIVQVPLPGDTLWLECTASAHVPLGHVHDGIAGNDALICDDGGGHLVKLPNYAPEQNVQRSTAHIALRPDGSALLDISQRSERRQYEDLMSLTQRTEQQRRDAMLGSLNVGMATLKELKFEEHKDSYMTPHIDVNMQVESRKLANITGTRMFVPVGIFHNATVPRALPKRAQPVDIDYGYQDVDSLIVSLPEGYEVEALPDAVSLTNALGEVNQTFTQHENQVTVVTRLLIRNGLYPADEYESLRRLKTAAKKAYDQRFVLKRK